MNLYYKLNLERQQYSFNTNKQCGGILKIKFFTISQKISDYINIVLFKLTLQQQYAHNVYIL